MDINLNDLTLGDLEEIEEIAGVTVAALFKGDLSTKALKAIVYVARRREDPSFTLEDAGNVRMADFTISDEADPTEAAS